MRWGVLWRSNNRLDGVREHLIYDSRIPLLFITRREARKFIAERYGYLRARPDLKAEPHGWKMPIPVKVEFQWSLK